MAIYTHLSDDQIAEFLKLYDLGTLKSAQGIAEGIENTNYLLTLNQGKGEESKAILTLFERRAKREDLPFYMRYMAHLEHKGINCPLPYRQHDDEVIGTLAGKPAVLTSFLQGRGVTQIEPVHLTDLGKELALMHRVVEDFVEIRPNDFAPHKLTALYQKTAPHLDTLQVGLQEALSKEMDAMQQWSSLKLASGVIHADLFPDNVFFEGEQLTGVIDFYFACTDYLAYDLAICLNAWCFEAEGALNQAKADALMLAYEQHRKLSVAEQENLPFLARGAALRFLLTRAHDWFFRVEGAVVTPKDPLEYVKKWEYWCSQ
jgi:homoserine kinase type II